MMMYSNKDGRRSRGNVWRLYWAEDDTGGEKKEKKNPTGPVKAWKTGLGAYKGWKKLLYQRVKKKKILEEKLTVPEL